MVCLLFPKRQILNSSELKEFADGNFALDENGGKFSERVENAVGKGEIAHNEQFLHFLQCFRKIVLQTRAQGLVLEKVNAFIFRFIKTNLLGIQEFNL